MPRYPRLRVDPFAVAQPTQEQIECAVKRIFGEPWRSPEPGILLTNSTGLKRWKAFFEGKSSEDLNG
jgi:hypothetical protein